MPEALLASGPGCLFVARLACGRPDLPGSGAWCVRVVVYGGAVAGGSQGWPVNSRVRASRASMPHLPAVDR